MFQAARAVTRINRFIGRWVSLAVIFLFVFLLIDVIMRYLIGRPPIWTSELATLICGGYAILGGGYLLADRAHVNVDIFYGKLSARRKALLDILTWPLFLLFVGVLLWQGWVIASDSIGRLERSNSIWNPPLWPTKLLIPVAAILLLLQGLVRLWADIRVVMGLPVPDDIFGSPASSNHAQDTQEIHP